MFELFHRDGFNRWEFVSLSSLPRWGLWAVGAVLLVSALVSLSALWRNPSTKRKGVLAVLRVAALTVIGLLVLEPAIQLQATERIKNRLAVLIDASASMGLKSGSERRIDAVTKFLQESRDQLTELSDSYVIDFYKVADGAVRLSGPDPGEPVGAQSDLLRGIQDAARDAGGRELGGMLLFSDGADNGALTAGEEPERILSGQVVDSLKQLGVPVHTFIAGDPEGFRDVSVHKLRTDDFAFVQNSVTVAADIAVSGYSSGALSVTLRREGRVVATKALSLNGNSMYPVEFTFTPDTVGNFVYTLAVQEMPGEALTVNNRKDFVLEVIRDKIRVLQVVGRPSWDERFLRQHLKSSPNVDLIAFHILRTPTDFQAVPQNELSLIPFPTYELFTTELHTFDVVIFQNFTFQPYGMAQYLPNIYKYVMDDGGAFVMIGGDQSFANGGYAGTPIEALLPVGIRLTDSVDEERFSPVLTAQGRLHPITALGRGLVPNEKVWENLPPLEGLNLVDAVKPEATVLLAHPTQRDRSGAPAPVVVVSDMGSGRVMSVMSDSTWFWQFVASQTGGGRAYGDFWNNAMRWLVRDPELTRIHVASDRDRYDKGETIEARVRVLGRDYRPVQGAQVTWSVAAATSDPTTTPAAAVKPPVASGQGVTDENGYVVVRADAGAGGPYRISAQARFGSEDLGSGQNLYLVTESETEYARPAPRPEVLEAISKVTGGEMRTLSSDALRNLTLKDPQVVRIDRRENIEIWDSWVWLLLAVTLLGLEWWYRRRWGYL